MVIQFIVNAAVLYLLQISYNLRDSLVMEMKSLEAPLSKAIQLKDNQEIESLMEPLEDNIWPKLVDASSVIRDNLFDDTKRFEEDIIQKNLKEIVDRLFQMAILYQLENISIF